jgi:hypothetical protein
MGQIAYFGFKIGILSVVIELFLLSYGPACMGLLSELTVAIGAYCRKIPALYHPFKHSVASIMSFQADFNLMKL